MVKRPHEWRLVSSGIGGFRYTPGTGRRSGTRKPVNILLLWILFRTTPVKNVWPPRSQSACSRTQVSAVLFHARTAKFVRAQICVGDTRVSPTSEGSATSSQSKHCPANAGSARPASPALTERNECVKETVQLKLLFIQISNAYGQSGAA